MLKILKAYLNWRARRRGDEFRDYDRGCGYYDLPKIGQEVEMKMQSGRVGIYKFLGSKNYWDPHDMIEHAWYQCLGYTDVGRFSQMTFSQFRKECAI